MASEIHNLIMAEYENRQRASRLSLEERTAEVYGKVPSIEAIDEEISISGIHFNKMILKGLIDPKEAKDKLDFKLKELQSRKAKLLIENGFNEDYLNVRYSCSKCKDTGYITTPEGTNKCSCYKQLLIEHLYTSSNLKPTENENFESFNESMYPDSVDEARYLSSRSPPPEYIKHKKELSWFYRKLSESG